MQEIIVKYLNVFRKLRIDRSHGIAPHKPILLLSVLQAFHEKQIADNRIYITPELVSLFKANWSCLVTTKHDCRISYPFYYLRGDKFWHLSLKNRSLSPDQLGSIVKSFSSLNSAIDFAYLSEDLYLLMIDKESNNLLQQFLLNQYFPETKINNSRLKGIQQELIEEIEGKIFHEDPDVYRKEIKKLLEEKNEEEIFIRGSLFKREIPKIYGYSCCISGMKIDSTLSVSMIDACHIVPFSESYDDTISNGIALCPNLHRAFDRGLITIDQQYKVQINPGWKENESVYSIKQFAKRQILLPKDVHHYPSLENLDIHRNKWMA